MILAAPNLPPPRLGLLPGATSRAETGVDRRPITLVVDVIVALRVSADDVVSRLNGIA